MKGLYRLILCLALLANSIPISAKANQHGGSVNISTNGDKIAIGNEYITRTFSKKNGIWKTESINNHRINKKFVPAEGSEDFIINLITQHNEEKPKVVYPTKALNREGWQATLKNKNNVLFKGVNVLFDGNKNTHIDEYDKAGFPISLEINLGTKQKVSSFSFLKRPGYTDKKYGINGTLGKFKLYVSENGSQWTLAGSGEFKQEDYNLHQENGLYNVGDLVYANFDKTYQTQYVKIEALSDALGNTEEFSGAEIQLYSDKVQKGLPVDEISLANKNITFHGEKTNRLNDGVLDYAISGKLNNEIVIDLGSEQKVGSFAYQKRPGYKDPNYGKNGTLGEYEIYVSDNSTNWKFAGKGAFTSKDYNLHSITLDQKTTTSDGTYEAGTLLHNVGDFVYGNLNQIYNTRYVKIVPKSDCLGGLDEFYVSEIKLFSDQKFEPKAKDTDIKSSELKVSEDGISIKDNEVRVSFDTYEKEGINWDIDMVTVMENNKHYMNTYLEITADKPQEAKIDYIDFDRFIIPEGTQDVWSIPDENQISSMWIGKHELMLGQPIYADGLFFGSEFPAQDSDVKNKNEMQMRYYSGKSITKMAEDHQNVIDGKTFRTWNNVVGAAKGTPSDVVQIDFFDYIEDISTPSNFRQQYNSWYDNMMNIDDASIKKSFLGAEKGLAENGVEPLDSYVVDDGWNNYNNDVGHVYAPNESGITKNQTGFWEFNSKFPNELYTSTELTDKFQSSFGVWVGPQGGYNFFGGFAKYLEAMGTGEMQTNSALGNVVCTGSRTYLQNYEKRFIDYQNRFNIDYWKWDGFASRPCNNPEHNHMVGGDHNMYFTSDMWEGWTNLIENARAARQKQGKELWINATCYINLSPWLLQWVNTIWVQDSGDTGEAGDASAPRHLRKIYYRDNVYYNLYKNNQIQFPLKNIYNHDPIYGVSDNSQATTEVFREFLFDNAMRGTAFWELYYSPSIMDNAKWKVTVDALDFAKTNHEVLKNAKLFVEEGKRPSNGVYGYSAWNQKQGFVSFVNPTSQPKTYTLTLNNMVGVPTSMQNLKAYQIYPYAPASSNHVVSYGDQLEVTLKPFSSVIYQYGTMDTQAPKLISAKITSDSTIEVRFDERMNDSVVFKVNGKEVEKTILDDYRTFQLSTKGLAKEADLTIENIKDIFGNAANSYQGKIQTSSDIAGFGNQEALSKQSEKDVTLIPVNNETHTLTNQGIKGTSDFSVSMAVQTKDTNVNLLQQADDFSIQIDADGYIKATIKDDVFSSKEEVKLVTKPASGLFGSNQYRESETQTIVKGKVNDGKLHSVQLVRELNGVLKIYIDGELSSSFYNKTNKNKVLSGNAIVLGDQNFIGFIGDVHVTNSAIYYDDAKSYAQNLNINISSKAIDKTKWTAKACSQASDKIGKDGAAESVLDNDPSTFWHTNYSGADTHDGPHTLQINFNQKTTFDNLEYVARPEGVAGNGTWESVKVYGLNGAKKELITETNEIKLINNTHTFAFTTPQTFDGIVFEILGKGGFASAAEIHATKNIPIIDASNLLKIKKDSKGVFDGVIEKEYTKDSYAAYKNAFESVMKLAANASQDQIQQAVANLDTAYKHLIKMQVVDKTQLYQLLQQYDKYKSSDYTMETWKPFYEAYQFAKDIYNNPKVTQKEVEKAISILQDTASRLVKAQQKDETIKDESTQVPEEIKPSKSPNTGLTSNLEMMMLLGIVSFGVLVAIKWKYKTAKE